MIRFLRARFHKRYLGQYVHARKLFFFDSALCVSLLVLGLLIVLFRLYDPKVILDDIRHIQKILSVPESPSPAVLPNIVLTASIGETREILPGDTVPMTISVRNGGYEPFNDVSITIPLSVSLIDMPRLFAASRGLIQGSYLSFTAKERDELASILPDEEFSMTVAIPIIDVPSSGDTDLTLTLAPRVRGNIAGEAVETRAETEAVHIGTALTVQARLHYYTDEGDQLGRGPLPPTVGKETKYGLLISVENSTSRVSPFTISGTLSPKATWTEKISVSHGLGVSFNPETRQFHFAIPVLDPHDAVRIFIELGFTPSSTDIGTMPVLVEEIRVNGRDVFINRAITKRLPPIDTSLPYDKKTVSLDKTVQSE